MNPLNLLSCTILAVVLLLAVATSGGVNAAADTDRITEGHGAPAATAVDRDHGTAEQNNGSGARVTGSEGPLRIRVSGIQSKQDTSLESSERTGDGVNEEENKAVRQDISPESDPVNRKAFVATTAAPLSRDSTTGNRNANDGDDDEEEVESSESMAKNAEESSASPNTWEQLGQAIKFMGNFVSWARAINPSAEQQQEEQDARSNAAILPGEQQRVQEQQRRKGLIGESRVDSGSQARSLDDSPAPAASTEVAEGRYIKGDPLKGYYDFVITEGSYKFWAVFQLATAALIIYSTLAAIYYSKVNPLTSDYDYVDFFGGRSLDSRRRRSLTDLDNTDVVDDDEEDDEGDVNLRSHPRNATGDEQGERSLLSDWSSMFEGGRRSWWVDTAASGFSFVLDAIDKIPQ